MSDNLLTYTRAAYLLDAVAARVPSTAWTAPTCCSDWDVRQVAGHAAWQIMRVRSAAQGNGPIDKMAEDQVLGQDPGAEIRTLVTSTLKALDHEGALRQPVSTVAGEMTVDEFVGLRWVDPLIHSWDIADAAGIAHGIDDPTAIRAYAALAMYRDSLHRSFGFAKPVECWDPSDPVAVLMAHCGRTPVG